MPRPIEMARFRRNAHYVAISAYAPVYAMSIVMSAAPASAASNPDAASRGEAIASQPQSVTAQKTVPRNARDNAPQLLPYRLRLSDPTRSWPRFRLVEVAGASFGARYSLSSPSLSGQTRHTWAIAGSTSGSSGGSSAGTIAPASDGADRDEAARRAFRRSLSDPGGEDTRSAWARWNSTLPGVSLTLGGVLVVLVLGFTTLPADQTGWGKPKFEGLKGDFTQGPRFDNDRFYWNYILHPIDGSEFYLMARNRDCNWWQSLAYSFGVSTFWEFFIESAYERASWQDLWITPLTGAFLGELRWQFKKSLEDSKTKKPVGTLNKILYVAIDPFDAVFSL